VAKHLDFYGSGRRKKRRKDIGWVLRISFHSYSSFWTGLDEVNVHETLL